MTHPVSHPADANLQPGDKIGAYEIVGPIGQGGMSRLWKAIDRLLDKPIAIKQLAVDFTRTDNVEALRERFRREAQLHKQVSASHKNLVKVIDLVEDARGLFLLMEYVEGQSLETYLARHPQPMDPKVALTIVAATAHALTALHEQNIVHRDLKPANILLPRTGGVKVCDFGLAAYIDEPISPDLGTVRYMAPEAFSEQTPDPRGDLYSLGMIAYEMLAGQEKFTQAFKIVLRDQRNQPLRWMKWHTNLRTTAPALLELRSDLPPALSELVARLMEKEISRRIGSARELIDALRRHFHPQQNTPPESQAPPPPVEKSGQAAAPAEIQSSAQPTVALPRRNRRPLYIAAGIAAVLALTLGVWGLSAYSKNQQAKQAREQAHREYAAAVEQFRQGNYTQALPMFEAIMEQWKDDPRLYAFSKAHSLLTQGELHYLAGEFAQAQNKYQEAENVGSLDRSFAELDRDLLKKRVNEVRTRMSVLNLTQEIEGLIREEKFADARERLQRIQRVSAQSLTPEESSRLQELGARIEGQERQAQITGVLERARELAAAGQREQALAFLETSLKRFPHRELQQLSTEFRREIEFENAMAELSAAETAGRWPQAAAAARKAMSLRRDDPVLRNRLNDVLSRAAYERGRRLEQGGDLSAARAAYLEATGLAENQPASEALARLLTAGQQESFLRAAEDAVAQNHWEAAIRHYEKALEIGPNPEVAAQLARARLNHKADQARSLIDDGDLAQARTLLTEVLRADESHPLAAAQVERLARLTDYQNALERGDALRKESRFGDAVREYRRAREIRDTPEVKQRLDEVEYESWLAQARREMSVKNWPAAHSALMAARNIRATEEVDKLLGDVAEAMKK